MEFILGKKLGMTTLYNEEKGADNVTLVECESNIVKVLRTKEKDGYSAIQMEVQKTKKRKFLKEFRMEGKEIEVKSGDNVGIDIFQIGDKVKVSGITKAKGFQGGVKRHGFSGAPKSHGHKDDLRAPGSIGSQAPQRVFKGTRMAGHMGGDRASVRNLKVVYLDKEKNILGIKGSVPGVNGRIVEIMKIQKAL